MKRALKFYPMYVDDFDEAVLHMSVGEVGVYLLALNESWKRGGIPDNPSELARLIRRKPSEVLKAWPNVSAHWKPSETPGMLVNSRQEKERSIAAEKSAKARKSATFRYASNDANADANACAPRVLHVSESCSLGSSVETSTEEKASTRARDPKPGLVLAEKPAVAEVMTELEDIYREAGCPISLQHKTEAQARIVRIHASKRHRLTDYVKWALWSGKWPNPGKTKALLNVLKDGDWDVELAPRTLPHAREPSKADLAREEGNRRFREMHPEI